MQAEQQRQLLLDEIFTLKQEIELLQIAVDSAKNNLEQTQASYTGTMPSTKASGDGMSAAQMLERRSRVSIVRDASLATSQPIYTDSFTIFYQESDDIKTALNTYFEQIYPENLAIQNPGETTQTAAAIAQAGSTSESSETAGAGRAPPSLTLQMQEDNRFKDSSFQPPKIESNKTSIIITGMKTDIDLAHQLIDDLDIPAKQVLVEVFMVNVSRNWQRKLEIQLDSVAGAIRPEARTLGFITNVAREAQNNQISIMPGRSAVWRR